MIRKADCARGVPSIQNLNSRIVRSSLPFSCHLMWQEKILSLPVWTIFLCILYFYAFFVLDK